MNSIDGNTPNTCAKGKFVKTYKYNGGTQFEPYYDSIMENGGTGPIGLPAAWANTNYLYTCDGVNGGAKTECRTGKIRIDGKCGEWANGGSDTCLYGTKEFTDAVSPIDGLNHAYRCTGINGGNASNCTSSVAVPNASAGACGEMDEKS
jgi:hypothetical protein